MERFPFDFVAQRNRRCFRVHVQQFVGNEVGTQRLKIRSVRLHLVQTVHRQEHDRIVHPAPRLGINDADRFRDSFQLPGCRVTTNHPQRSGCRTDQGSVPIGNQRRRRWPHVGTQCQLKHDRSAFVADVHRVIPVGVIAHPARVDRVVLPGDEQAVTIDRPERAVRGNRSRGCHKGLCGAHRLRVQLHQPRSAYRVDELLTRHQEPGRGASRSNCSVCDRLQASIRQHAQNRLSTAGAGDVHRHHVENRRTQRVRDELRQPLPTSATQPSGDVVLHAHVHAPGGRVRSLSSRRST